MASQCQSSLYPVNQENNLVYPLESVTGQEEKFQTCPETNRITWKSTEDYILPLQGVQNLTFLGRLDSTTLHCPKFMEQYNQKSRSEREVPCSLIYQ